MNLLKKSRDFIIVGSILLFELSIIYYSFQSTGAGSLVECPPEHTHWNLLEFRLPIIKYIGVNWKRAQIIFSNTCNFYTVSFFAIVLAIVMLSVTIYAYYNQRDGS